MGRKSRRNKSVRHEPKRPAPAPMARQVLDALLQDAKIERMHQAEIWQGIVTKHRGDPPARACRNFMADRRESARGAA